MDLLEKDPETMRRAGIEDLPFRTEVNQRGILNLREPYRPVDESLFSKSDLKVFDEIVAKYGDKTFDELFRITHRHYAYNRAWNSRGSAKRAAMRYEDMIDDEARRQEILEDIGPVASRLR